MKFFDSEKVRVEFYTRANVNGKQTKIYKIFSLEEGRMGYFFCGNFTGKTAEEAYRNYLETLESDLVED